MCRFALELLSSAERLFPLREPGVNYMASELTKKEIEVSESWKPKRTLLTELIMTSARCKINIQGNVMLPWKLWSDQRVCKTSHSVTCQHKHRAFQNLWQSDLSALWWPDLGNVLCLGCVLWIFAAKERQNGTKIQSAFVSPELLVINRPSRRMRMPKSAWWSPTSSCWAFTAFAWSTRKRVK